MEEILKEYAEGILSASGGILILGIVVAIFLGKDSPFIQMIGNIIGSSL